MISRYTSVILQTKKMSIRLSPSNVSLEGYKIRVFISDKMDKNSYVHLSDEEMKYLVKQSYNVENDARKKALSLYTDLDLIESRKHTPVFVRSHLPDLKSCILDGPSKKCVNRKVRFVEADTGKCTAPKACGLPKGHFKELDEWVRHQRNGTEQTYGQVKLEKALLEIYFLKEKILKTDNENKKNKK